MGFTDLLVVGAWAAREDRGVRREEIREGQVRRNGSSAASAYPSPTRLDPVRALRSEELLQQRRKTNYAEQCEFSNWSSCLPVQNSKLK
ncbi:Protein of unknown function [Gryllus bimaculatus]|nr:Protein of unknown function [Gryllus bimaculatus]